MEAKKFANFIKSPYNLILDELTILFTIERRVARHVIKADT